MGEGKLGGPLVVGALYGDLGDVDGEELATQPLSALAAGGLVQNVTRQVQCLAEAQDTRQGTQLRIVLPPKPKHGLPGVRDVAPGRPKVLLVRYWYAGAPHQAVVEDDAGATLPRKAHACACPHLGADEAAMTPLAACLQAPAALQERGTRQARGTPPQSRARARRRSMLPGDAPLLDAPGQTVLLAAASPPPRRLRRPSAVTRRAPLPAALAATEPAEPASTLQLQRPPAGASGWLWWALAGLALAAAGAAVWRVYPDECAAAGRRARAAVQAAVAGSATPPPAPER